ncbi:ABC transporter substrate-binding protein [Sporichthya brevicatena]|uniref:ABC transporter substrate-binding protein n=1 Tax=Sporichthya brevicatena TaxID=171442 RepID=A0ABN1GM12_9ACTN
MASGRFRSASALTLVLALALSACGGGNDDASAPGTSPDEKPAAVAFGVDDNAVGPAPPVEGATPGGTVRVLDDSDIAHLDPARIYVNTAGMVAGLMMRTLTGYRQVDGKVELVGDLATNTGVTKDNGKTWTYTLRDGVTWEDGSPITSADVKYGIERTFFSGYAEGPTYLQEWLTGRTDFRKVYAGPYNGQSLKAISTPDEKTVVLKFPKAQADVPFALTMVSTGPVRKSNDTRGKYDQRPFASGPYKIGSRQIDKSMTLVRNEAWKAESDPIRYQYPDKYEFLWGDQRLAQYQRIIAGNGGDAAAVPLLANIATELLAQVTGNPDLNRRMVAGYTPFVFYFAINTLRITDVEVRKALLHAVPRQQMRQIAGGPIVGDFANTISGPTLVGHEDSSVHGATPAGDPAKARSILEAAGKVGQKIVYAYPQTDDQERIAVVVERALSEAGFEVVTKRLSVKNYYDEIGKLDAKLDLFQGGWGWDWPGGGTVYPPLLHSSRAVELGTNFAHFRNQEIDAEIDRISTITDPVAAGKEWAELDRKVMALVPMIPYRYDRAVQLAGERIGNATLDVIFGIINLNGLYVKS